MVDTRSFYVVAHEPGAEHPALPSWASSDSNPAMLAEAFSIEGVARREVSAVPGAFQVLNVLSAVECQRLIFLSESLGYLKDAAVSLPRSIRHNDNVVWIADETSTELLWQRVVDSVKQSLEVYGGKVPLGLNARFRFYRYAAGDYFKPHTDGAWPGSRVVDGKLLTDAFGDRYSLMTFLLYLNDDFEGGATRFRAGDSGAVDIRTPMGGALCFPHGPHPWHCVHSAEPILHGTKYIIRSDVLFEL